MEFDSVIDTGNEREESPTGAQREINDTSGRFDLIPPTMMRRLAQHYQNGANKYAERNWEKGLSVTRCIDSTLRHINKWREGYREEDHLVAAIWNLTVIVHQEELLARGLCSDELFDHPTYLPQQPAP